MDIRSVAEVRLKSDEVTHRLYVVELRDSNGDLGLLTIQPSLSHILKFAAVGDVSFTVSQPSELYEAFSERACATSGRCSSRTWRTYHESNNHYSYRSIAMFLNTLSHRHKIMHSFLFVILFISVRH